MILVRSRSGAHKTGRPWLWDQIQHEAIRKEQSHFCSWSDSCNGCYGIHVIQAGAEVGDKISYVATFHNCFSLPACQMSSSNIVSYEHLFSCQIQSELIIKLKWDTLECRPAVKCCISRAKLAVLPYFQYGRKRFTTPPVAVKGDHHKALAYTLCMYIR